MLREELGASRGLAQWVDKRMQSLNVHFPYLLETFLAGLASQQGHESNALRSAHTPFATTKRHELSPDQRP